MSVKLKKNIKKYPIVSNKMSSDAKLQAQTDIMFKISLRTFKHK